MKLVRRIVRVLVAALAFGTYVWFAAVRYTPFVKERKKRRRSARLTGK